MAKQREVRYGKDARKARKKLLSILKDPTKSKEEKETAQERLAEIKELEKERLANVRSGRAVKVNQEPAPTREQFETSTEYERAFEIYTLQLDERAAIKERLNPDLKPYARAKALDLLKKSRSRLRILGVDVEPDPLEAPKANADSELSSPAIDMQSKFLASIRVREGDTTQDAKYSKYDLVQLKQELSKVQFMRSLGNSEIPSPDEVALAAEIAKRETTASLKPAKIQTPSTVTAVPAPPVPKTIQAWRIGSSDSFVDEYGNLISASTPIEIVGETSWPEIMHIARTLKTLKPNLTAQAV